MVRLFDIRDVSVVQRLSPLGRALAYEPVAVEGLSPLREAMRSYAAASTDNRLVMVRRSQEPDAEAFGLMQLMADESGSASTAQRFGVLLYVAPTPRNETVAAAWIDLVQAMLPLAAARGAMHVIAEAPDEGYELGALQCVGFSPLVHQDVMKLAHVPGKLDAKGVAGLREQREGDDPLIRLLAMRTVPKPIQKTESSSDLTRMMYRVDCGFMLFEQNELAGQVSFRRGKRGYGMQAMFQASAEPLVEATLQYALAQLCGRAQNRPVYCTVPSYQSWLLPILDKLGFSHVTSNVLMIRHTAATVQQPVWTIGAKAHARKALPGQPNAHHTRTARQRRPAPPNHDAAGAPPTPSLRG